MSFNIVKALIPLQLTQISTSRNEMQFSINHWALIYRPNWQTYHAWKRDEQAILELIIVYLLKRNLDLRKIMEPNYLRLWGLPLQWYNVCTMSRGMDVNVLLQTPRGMPLALLCGDRIWHGCEVSSTLQTNVSKVGVGIYPVVPF